MKPKVIIYHSVLGIRQGERDMAYLVETMGFEAFIPDLYEGRVFDNYEEALAFFNNMGVEGLIKVAETHLQDMSGPLIFAGFSNGGALAEVMAVNYPDTVGCLLFHAALPVSEFGETEWPSHIPVQIHYADADPWREEKYVQQFLLDVTHSGAPVQLLEYPIKGHLFTDSTLPNEYNEQATEQMYQYVKEFLSQYLV